MGRPNNNQENIMKFCALLLLCLIIGGCVETPPSSESSNTTVYTEATVTAATCTEPTEEPPTYVHKVPEGLDPSLALQIREDYLELFFLPQNDYNNENRDRIKLSDIFIVRYLGNYNGLEIVEMNCSLFLRADSGVILEFAGYVMEFSYMMSLYAYKDPVFLPIQEAYETGIISREDVYEIVKQAAYCVKEKDYHSE
jgi:hypothetical protein